MIYSKASPEVVVNGWKSLGKFVPTDRLLIPFLYSTAIDYVRFSISGVEPKWTALLRLCYWHERCLELKDKKFHYKQTEMKRAILKPLRNTEKALKNKGKGFLPAMEQLHKAISSYTSELSLAVLANECNKVTFGKGHDFVFDVFPYEVKSVYSHMTIQREGDRTTPKLKIHGQTLGEKVNPYEEFLSLSSAEKS